MKTEQNIKAKVMEHEIQIEYIRSLENVPKELTISDIKRLEYGKKALLWVLSDDDLLKP